MRQTSQDTNPISPLMFSISVINQTIKVIHEFKHSLNRGYNALKYQDPIRQHQYGHDQVRKVFCWSTVSFPCSWVTSQSGDCPMSLEKQLQIKLKKIYFNKNISVFFGSISMLREIKTDKKIQKKWPALQISVQVLNKYRITLHNTMAYKSPQHCVNVFLMFLVAQVTLQLSLTK